MKIEIELHHQEPNTIALGWANGGKWTHDGYQGQFFCNGRRMTVTVERFQQLASTYYIEADDIIKHALALHVQSRAKHVHQWVNLNETEKFCSFCRVVANLTE